MKNFKERREISTGITNCLVKLPKKKMFNQKKVWFESKESGFDYTWEMKLKCETEMEAEQLISQMIKEDEFKIIISLEVRIETRHKHLFFPNKWEEDKPELCKIEVAAVNGHTKIERKGKTVKLKYKSNGGYGETKKRWK